LGNLLGSNIFNVFAVLGITAIITPIQIVDRDLVDQDMIWMLAFALVVLPLVFLPKGLRLNWKDGLVLLMMYGAFLYQTLG
jgi:cation:H+ antiporter